MLGQYKTWPGHQSWGAIVMLIAKPCVGLSLSLALLLFVVAVECLCVCCGPDIVFCGACLCFVAVACVCVL